MQKSLIIIMVGLALYWYYRGPNLGGDLAALVKNNLPGVKAFPEPSPHLTKEEIQGDMPKLNEFWSSSHREVSVSAARAFGLEDGVARSQCSTRWLAAVNGMPSGSIVEETTVLGRAGICTWHQMQIIASDGRKIAELIRPGPRVVSGEQGQVR
jgi:hypothetical protein